MGNGGMFTMLVNCSTTYIVETASKYPKNPTNRWSIGSKKEFLKTLNPN